MAGKGIISKTDVGTYIFQLVVEGKTIDRIEVDELEMDIETSLIALDLGFVAGQGGKNDKRN